jgi:hypothetical protein
MLHSGLGVGLAVADLLPLLPPPVRRLRALTCTLPVIMSSKMLSSEATSNCSASGSALTKSDSLVLSSCS